MTGAAPAFLRFSRDRRGYEHFYLVQSSTNRRGKTRARILFWFRTPPGVKVGRQPFSDEVQRAIEAQNPGVIFDWKRLLATPIPPPAPDVERWRERRRLEKAEKAARRAVQTADSEDEAADADAPEPGGDAPPAGPVGDDQSAAASPEPSGAAPAVNRAPEGARSGATSAAAHPSRRRRRRRRGGRRGSEVSGAPEAPPADSAAPSSNEED